MNIYTVDFMGVYPVGSELIIRASDKNEALNLARLTIKHADVELSDVTQIALHDNDPQVLCYLSGDY